MYNDVWVHDYVGSANKNNYSIFHEVKKNPVCYTCKNKKEPKKKNYHCNLSSNAPKQQFATVKSIILQPKLLITMIQKQKTVKIY